MQSYQYPAGDATVLSVLAGLVVLQPCADHPVDFFPIGFIEQFMACAFYQVQGDVFDSGFLVLLVDFPHTFTEVSDGVVRSAYKVNGEILGNSFDGPVASGLFDTVEQVDEKSRGADESA